MNCDLSHNLSHCLSFFLSQACSILDRLLWVLMLRLAGLPLRLHFKKVCHCALSVITYSCTPTDTVKPLCPDKDNEIELNRKWAQTKGCSGGSRKNWIVFWLIAIQPANEYLLFFGLQFSSNFLTLHIPHLFIHSVSLHFSPYPVCTCTFSADRHTSIWTHKGN